MVFVVTHKYWNVQYCKRGVVSRMSSREVPQFPWFPVFFVNYPLSKRPLLGNSAICSRAARLGFQTARGVFPDLDSSVPICPFLGFLDFRDFPIFKGQYFGFSLFVLSSFSAYENRLQGTFPERVQDTIRTFREKDGKLPGLGNPPLIVFLGKSNWGFSEGGVFK